MALAIRSVLVPVDFSDVSELVLRYGAEMARDYGAELHVVTVVESSDVMIELDDPLGVRKRWRAEGVEKAQVELAELARRVLGRRKHAEAVLEGEPADEIVRYCEANEVELLVIGSHGARGFIRDWLGGVTYQVMKKSECPVLVVKPGMIEVELEPVDEPAEEEKPARSKPARRRRKGTKKAGANTEKEEA